MSDENPEHRRRRLWFAALAMLAVGLVVRAWLGYASPSLYWGDEIYQTFEQAHRLIFGHGVEIWEYEKGIRSWVFTGILAAVMKVGHVFGEGSTGYLAVSMTFLSLLSLIPAVVAFRWADREHDAPWWPLLALLFPLVWFDLVYFAPKAFYETFTAHLAVGAIFLVRFADDRWFQSATGGLILGLCIINRPHLAPMAVALALAIPMFADRPHHRFSSLVIGVCVGLGIGGAVDYWTYGAPFHSSIMNFQINVIEEKAKQWGTSPYWQYPVWLWEASPVGAVMMGAALLAGCVRYPALAWPALAILLAHSAIGHKEYRFIYPVIVFAITLAGLEAAHLGSWAEERLGDWEVPFAAPAVATAIALAVTGVSLYGGWHFNVRSTGKHGEVTNWEHHRGKLLAYRYLSTREDICGVGRMKFPFWETGGYTYLHHDIPIVPMEGDADLKKHADSLDVAVAANRSVDKIGEFERTRCFGSICVYIRPGDCTATPPDRGL